MIMVGVFGAVIELLMIPIVRLITGEDVENRALQRCVSPFRPAFAPLHPEHPCLRRNINRW